MQHKMTAGPLLNEDGNLAEPGYAFSLVKNYSRKDIKTSKWRIKEWDYYYFGNNEYGVALTIDDNGYMSLSSISFLDFKAKKQKTVSKIGAFPFGKVNLPPTSEKGDLKVKKKGYSILFLNDGNVRHIIATMKNFDNKQDFYCDLVITNHNNDSMVIATPFDKNKHFYYNQKINNLEANGLIRIGEKEIKVNSWFGVLDWGRGVWTYSNTWYWSSLSTKQDDHYIGFNLGYGFGNNKAASENVLFYDGKAYKFEDVEFKIPTDSKGIDDFMKPWIIESKNKDIYLTFTPILDRYANSDILIISSLQHQVFGMFNGFFILNGKKIEIRDVLSFAEKVKNKW